MTLQVSMLKRPFKHKCALACLVIFILISLCLFEIYLVPEDEKEENFKREVPARRERQIHLRLCEDYRIGKISGDLCDFLCHRSRNWNVNKLSETSERVSLTFQFHDDDVPITLRSSKPFFDWYMTQSMNFSNERELLSMAVNAVREHLHYESGNGFDHRILQTLYPKAARISLKSLSQADWSSLFALLQQREYLMFKLTSPLSKASLETLGTCGHMYRVDSISPIPRRFIRRKKSFSHLTLFLKHINFFPGERLEWCNVNASNLGIINKTLKITNGNHLYTASKLENLFANMKCASDDDCFIGHCRSSCLQNGFCAPYRKNNNLDTVCERIINPAYSNNKRAAKTMIPLLRTCLNMGNTTQSERMTEMWQAWRYVGDVTR